MTTPSTTHPSIVAHRGVTENGLIENTVEALNAATESGVAAVEFDVRRTADGEWILHHDKTLERVHGCNRTIADLALDDLQALVPVATLDEALAVFDGARPCLPMVEIKEPDTAGVDRLCEVLDRHGRRIPIVAIARGREMPAAVKRATTDVRVFLYTPDWREALERAEEDLDGYDLSRLIPNTALIDECLDRFEARSQEIAVWTVNHPDEARRWLDLGVRWVITDRPLELGHALR